jgi:hypothetical protein
MIEYILGREERGEQDIRAGIYDILECARAGISVIEAGDQPGISEKYGKIWQPMYFQVSKEIAVAVNEVKLELAQRAQKKAGETAEAVRDMLLLRNPIIR